MKKTYLLIMAFLAIVVGAAAQTTDVTATYLTNADFETTPTGVTVDNTIYDVPGWVESPAAGVLNYSKLGTLAYGEVNAVLGTVPANGSSVADANTALLGMKVHWGPATLSLSQTINLPAGKYTLTWDSYLAQVVTSQLSMCGYVIDDVATYDPLPTTVGTWKNHSLTFTLLTAKDVTIRLGYNKTANVGSALSPIFFADNVKLLKFDQVDKTALEALLATANTMKADPQPVGASTVYTDLDNAITAAQLVVDNTSATLAEVVEQEEALTAVIAAVNSAILIQQRISTWTTLPYDITSLIVNPTIEGTDNNTAPNGWTVSKGSGNTMTTTGEHYSLVKTNRYFDSWNGTAGALLYTAQQTIKDIPNGIYKLKAAARTSGAGSYLYAKTSGSTYRTEIINLGSAGGTLGNGFNTITVEVPVLDNTMTIGVTTDKNVSEGSAWAGTWFSADDFTLSYISDGSPYLLDVTNSLFFDKITSVRTFTVKGGNLSANATLTAPAGVALDKTSLTPAEVAAGTIVTATHDGSTVIANGEIVISTTGAANSIVTVNAQPDNATSAIVNPNFSNGTNGWTSTTTAQNKTTATNKNEGAFEGTMPFYENWKSDAFTGKIYQVVNGLPAGRYLLKMGVFGNNGGEGMFVYGDTYETAVSGATAPTFFEVEFVTPGGSAEIGLNIKSGTNNWVGIDNVSLKYLGAVLDPLLSVSTTNLFLSENVATKTFTVIGTNLTDDVTITASEGSGLTPSLTAIAKNDSRLADGIAITLTYNPAEASNAIVDGTVSVVSDEITKTIAVKSFKNPTPANLLGLALGNGYTGAGSEPSTFGWSSTNTSVVWSEAVSSGVYSYAYRDGLRPADIPRIINHPVDNAIFSFPVVLEEGKSYLFSCKNSNFNNGSLAVSATFSINSTNDGTGTELASQTAKSGSWDTSITDFKFGLDVTEAGQYYLLWQTADGVDRNFAYDFNLQEAFKVTFNSNDGSDVDTQYLISGTTVAEPTAPTKDEATFVGWFADDALTTAWDFETAVTANMTLYAKWDINTGLSSAKDELISTEYYTLQGQRLERPVENGVYLVRKSYASQKVEVVKVVYKSKQN